MLLIESQIALLKLRDLSVKNDLTVYNKRQITPDLEPNFILVSLEANVECTHKNMVYTINV